jgi:hypothetical protein
MGMGENIKHLKQALGLACVDVPPGTNVRESKQGGVNAALTMFVPPVTAPLQASKILTSTQKGRKCS